MVLQAEPTPGGLDVGAGPAPASLPAHLENSLLPRAVSAPTNHSLGLSFNWLTGQRGKNHFPQTHPLQHIWFVNPTISQL